MSDAEYDRLFRELEALEAENPSLRTPDSPTLRVGAEPVSALRKHSHRFPMLSLANAFDDNELRAWETRNARLLPTVKASGYHLELKIDGAAVNLTYREGTLAVGCTRGNGTVGEDITANVRTIADVPLRLQGEGWPPEMEVRGEVYFPLDRFATLNAERRAGGEPEFANPRNSAAGSLRQLDSRITRARRLRFFAFQVATDHRLPFQTQEEVLDALQAWGFPTAPHRKRVPSLDDAIAHIAQMEPLMPSLNFQADGVVVKVDRLVLHDELGVVGGREPRWAIARKFAPEVALTTLREIRINVGRTGALNPYAVLEPIEVGGVTVSTATLHNFDLVEAKDIRIGDTVEVTRAGEVIPQVLGPVRERRTGGEQVFRAPSQCPECHSPVERPEGEVMAFCPNVSCPGRVVEGIIHFASRSAMDIRGLGQQRVEQLWDEGLIQDVADLYEIDAAQLEALEGFGVKAATQLVDAIAESKRQPLATLLFALGIRHVGAASASLLAEQFGTMDRLTAAGPEELAAVEGIGPTIAAAVVAFFADEANRTLVDRLRVAGLTFEQPQTATGTTLAGQTIVLTGTLPTLARDAAITLIEAAGGKVTASVSGKTSLVVAGENAGSKLERARSLGIPVIGETELLRRVGRDT